MTPAVPEFEWHARGAAGVAHAYPVRSRRVAALCGERRHDVRFDWPVQERCTACVDLSQQAIRDAIAVGAR